MIQYYDRISPCRIRRNTLTYGEKNARLLSLNTEAVYGLRFAPFFSVYDRITPYTVTDIYDRNTVSCNTATYDRLRRNTARTRAFTAVYGLRNRRPGKKTNRRRRCCRCCWCGSDEWSRKYCCRISCCFWWSCKWEGRSRRCRISRSSSSSSC